MSASDRHLLLVNPTAGGGRARELLPRAQAELDRRQIAHRTVFTESIEHGCREALAAGAAGEIPVVISGDGLIGRVGGVLAETSIPLGLIPAGRGNDLARVLGVPAEVEPAVGLLETGNIREIDVGEVNEQRFLGIASCGFDSDANRIANEARWLRGRFVYFYAALRALAAWKPARFELTLDGECHRIIGFSVGAANNSAYGGGMVVAPGAELDDGLLEVIGWARSGKLRFLRNLPKVYDGSHVEIPEVDVWRAPEVRIEADREFAVYADGDHLADLPATVRILPRSLRVIVP